MKTRHHITGLLLLITLPSAEALSHQNTLILVGGGIAALLLAVLTCWYMMRRKKRLRQKARTKAAAAQTTTTTPSQTTLDIPSVVITLAESPQPERQALQPVTVSELKASVIVIPTVPPQPQNSQCGAPPEFASAAVAPPIAENNEPPYESLYSFMKQENVEKVQSRL